MKSLEFYQNLAKRNIMATVKPGEDKYENYHYLETLLASEFAYMLESYSDKVVALKSFGVFVCNDLFPIHEYFVEKRAEVVNSVLKDLEIGLRIELLTEDELDTIDDPESLARWVLI